MFLHFTKNVYHVFTKNGYANIQNIYEALEIKIR